MVSATVKVTAHLEGLSTYSKWKENSGIAGKIEAAPGNQK
jgi:hypothetical protein